MFLGALCLAVAVYAADTQVSRLIDASPNFMPADSNQALAQLERLGDAAIPELVRALEERTDQGELYFVCTAVGRLPSDTAISGLAKQIHRPDWLIRSACGSAYGKVLVANPYLGESEREPLRKLIRTDSNCSVRVNGASAVGPLEDTQLRRAMLPSLQQGTACDKRTAMSLLRSSKVDKTRIAEPILAMLTNPNEDDWVREDAAMALGELAYLPARPALIALIEQQPEPKRNIKAFAVQALGQVGTPADIPLLKDVLNNDKYGPGGARGARAKQAIIDIRIRHSIR